MFRFVSLLLFVSSLIVSGCQSGERSVTSTNVRPSSAISDVVVHSRFSNSVALKALPSEYTGAGRGIGFIRYEDRDTYQMERPQTEEISVDGGEPLSLWLTIGNGEGQPRTFLVTMILDYDQVEFDLDGQEGLLHEVTVPVSTDMEMPFDLDVGGPGAHDLQVIAFDYPYNLTLDDNFRMDLGGHVASRRAVIIVGGEDSPARSLPNAKTGWPQPTDVTFKPRVAFASLENPADVHPSQRQLYVGHGEAGTAYRFQMFLNDQEGTAVSYAIVPFMDFHQVNILGENRFLVNLEPGQELVMDMSVDLAKEPGIYQFQVVYVFDPYRSVLRDEVLSSFVFASPRIAVDAR